MMSKNTYKTVRLAAASVFLGISGIASGQPAGGLFDVLNSVSNILKPPAQKNTSSTAAADGPAALLKNLAAADTDSSLNAEDACKKSSIAQKSAEADMKLERFAGASAGYYLAAHDVAVCAVGEASPGKSLQRYTLPEAYNLAGSFLALSAIADIRGGLVSDRSRTNAKHAVILLEVNKTEGDEKVIKVLSDAGLLPSEKVEKPEAGNSGITRFSAKDAVAQLKSNTYAFNSKYENRPLAITGKIGQISGSGKSASVRLEGYVPPDINNLAWRDSVMCNISDPGSLTKVANLQTGQTTTVTGRYEPKYGGIQLTDCRLD